MRPISTKYPLISSGNAWAGVATEDELGDVQRQGTHTLGVGDVFQGGDDGAEVASHRGLQGQQSEGVLFGAGGVVAQERRSPDGPPMGC